jgi:hypothetical protein
MIRRTLAVAVLMLLGMQHLTSKGQQEMSEEVAALHRAVFEVRDDTTLGDPALWRELAIRYLYGRGVERRTVQRGPLATIKWASTSPKRYSTNTAEISLLTRPSKSDTCSDAGSLG